MSFMRGGDAASKEMAESIEQTFKRCDPAKAGEKLLWASDECLRQSVKRLGPIKVAKHLYRIADELAVEGAYSDRPEAFYADRPNPSKQAHKPTARPTARPDPTWRRVVGTLSRRINDHALAFWIGFFACALLMANGWL